MRIPFAGLAEWWRIEITERHDRLLVDLGRELEALGASPEEQDAALKDVRKLLDQVRDESVAQAQATADCGGRLPDDVLH